eukprot:COSAG01_NODE_4464_length_5000_cov_37.356662_2_plen_129_part_00
MKVSALVVRYLDEVPRACGMSVSSIRCALAVSRTGTETAVLKQIPYIEINTLDSDRHGAHSISHEATQLLWQSKASNPSPYTSDESTVACDMSVSSIGCRLAYFPRRTSTAVFGMANSTTNRSFGLKP